MCFKQTIEVWTIIHRRNQDNILQHVWLQ